MNTPSFHNITAFHASNDGRWLAVEFRVNSVGIIVQDEISDLFMNITTGLEITFNNQPISINIAY